jgi:hypothetical protein
MGRLSNPAGDFAHACDQGRRGRERRKNDDAGAAWRIRPGNRQVQRRLGRADVEQLIAAYEEGNPVAQLVARFNVNRTTVLAHLDRHGVPRRQTAPKLSATDIARAADLYRDGLSLAAIGQRFRVNASTVGKALGELMCRFAQDAVGRAPELELAWGSELQDGLSCLGPPTDVAQRAGGWGSRPPAHTMSIAGARSVRLIRRPSARVPVVIGAGR